MKELQMKYRRTNKMTDNEAIKTIQDRIGEMLKSAEVRRVMLKAKREGKTEEEIGRQLTLIAIATLVGA